jgi:hypothetical protein
MQVAEELIARSLGAVLVAPVEFTVVVPELVAWIVSWPDPVWIIVIWVPIGNATDAFVGMLIVPAVDELDARRISPWSPSTSVYAFVVNDGVSRACV